MFFFFHSDECRCLVHLSWGYYVRLRVDVVLMVPMRLLVMAVVVMVWQVWLDKGWGCGGAQRERVGGKHGGGYCETFAIFNS